ncbi:MAG: MATE family efflux transporter [Myxococcota bacterium]
MTNRSRKVLHLALPIIGGMVSQNVLNLVDTAMVGQLGDDALAAVGLASFVNFLVTAFILGISPSVQAIAARRVGEGKQAESAVALNGGILISVVIAVPWQTLLFYSADLIFPQLIDDLDVIAAAVPYLQSRVVAMVAMGINYSFRGYWNATDRSMLYMRTLLVMHVCNIALNWILIFGHWGAPALGPTGAGIASAIATYVGTISYAFLGLRHARKEGFLIGVPPWTTLKTMLRLAVPSGIQQTFFAGGMVAFFVIVGKVGTKELAATQVLTQLLLVGILPGLGFGLAAASLVGQALGRQDVEDARRWGWEVARIACAVIFLLSLPAIFVPGWMLHFFIHDAETLKLAIAPLRIVGISLCGDVVGMVLMNAIVGAGATLQVMFVSLGMQWLVFLPFAYFIGPVSGFGLTAIWICNVCYRLTQSLVFALLWRQGSWARTSV